MSPALQKASSRSFEFVYEVTIPPSASAKPGKLRLWLPIPRSDDQQKISALRLEAPSPYQLRTEPEYGNRYAYMDVNAAARSEPAVLRLRFTAIRRENRVSLAPSAAKDGSVNSLARFLKPDRLVPLDGLIGDLAARNTRGLAGPAEKARAIYDYVVSTMRYDKTGAGWGRGDAIYACNARKGNCTDFHALLIGMMRAAGIPARFEIGFSLPPDQRSGDIPGYHCWAQFYLDGVGWVPVDASEAWKNPARRNYFFGAHDEHRILFTRGRDVRLQPAQRGEPLNYFVYPYAELDGRPLDGIQTRFSFRDRSY